MTDIESLLSQGYVRKLYVANRQKQVRTPLGIFASAKAAGIAYGLSGTAIKGRINDRKPGYEYVCPNDQQKVIEKTPVPIVRTAKGHHIRTPETLKKMSQAKRNPSPQARANHIAANKAKKGIPNPHNNKAVRTPLGKFDSITQAAEAHNLNWAGTIRERIKRGVPGYEYV
jgi:hypothetical protein